MNNKNGYGNINAKNYCLKLNKLIYTPLFRITRKGKEITLNLDYGMIPLWLASYAQIKYERDFDA